MRIKNAQMIMDALSTRYVQKMHAIYISCFHLVFKSPSSSISRIPITLLGAWVAVYIVEVMECRLKVRLICQLLEWE